MIGLLNWFMRVINSDVRFERAKHKVAKPGPWAG